MNDIHEVCRVRLRWYGYLKKLDKENRGRYMNIRTEKDLQVDQRKLEKRC